MNTDELSEFFENLYIQESQKGDAEVKTFDKGKHEALLLHRINQLNSGMCEKILVGDLRIKNLDAIIETLGLEYTNGIKTPNGYKSGKYARLKSQL